MTEEKNKMENKKESTDSRSKPMGGAGPKKTESKGVAGVVAKSVYGAKQKNKRFNKKSRNNAQRDEFEQKILDLARVTRVMAGGKRMRFRACVAIGDKKGKVGIGLGKGADVTIAINKAVNKAKKDLVEVPIVNNTIPHEVRHKFSAAQVLFKPARKGRGVIAGGIIRIIMELAGVKNVTSKILGTTNKVSNAKCAIEALKKLKKIEKTDKKDNKESKKNEKKADKIDQKEIKENKKN
jgi:small subunit ribosomal protein S5